MPATLKPTPRKKASLPIHRWTRQEVYSLCDQGWFADRRVNLLNGRIVVMPMPSPVHYWCVKRLAVVLGPLIPAGYHDRSENALAVGTYNDPGPDYAIAPGSYEDYLNSYPTTALLVVEVAKSTLYSDLKVKPAIYARAAVPEYWVLDLENRRLVVHREPLSDPASHPRHRYTAIRTLEPQEEIAPLFSPANAIKVESMLPPASS